MSLCNTADVVVEQHKRMHVKLKYAHQQKHVKGNMCMQMWQKDIFPGLKQIDNASGNAVKSEVDLLFPWLIQKHERT